MTKINPVAKALLQSRRRTQYVPNKKKHNRKRDKGTGYEYLLSEQDTRGSGRDALRQTRSEDDT